MSKDADSNIVVSGPWRTIEYAVCANGSMPAREFIEGLDESDQRKMATLFQRMAEHGNVPNREQFKPVRGKIFEFKKHRIRVFCFRESGRDSSGKRGRLPYGILLGSLESLDLGFEVADSTLVLLNHGR